VADSDTSDVLVALGLNSFFTGTGASDIALRADLEVDPTGISTSLSGANGDNQVLLSLLGLKETSVAGLGQSTFSQSYEKTVGDFGFETAAALNAFESNESLRASLEQLQQSVSGVNVDEELVDLVRFEQAFAAAGQYISVVNGLQDELMNLV
jgi:flagellar hook-associated protein FlgK